MIARSMDAPGRPLLASRSPRRRLLLSRSGIGHDVVETGIEDADLRAGAVSPAQWAGALAYLKARAGAPSASPERPVIGADTICVQGGRIHGQPRDAGDARRMLRLFEGAEHEVITGLAVLAGDRRYITADRACVRMGILGDDRIETYIAGGEWRGKAGAYNLSERLEAGWPIEYRGDPSTVMGLPMGLLTRLLARIAPHEAGVP